MEREYEPLFEPIDIGGCRIKNRYAMAPMGCFGMTDTEGIITDDCIEYYVERARGGVGLIVTGMTIVEDAFEKNVKPTLPFITAGTNHARLRVQLMKLTERVHAHDCRIFLQMSGGFGRATRAGTFANGHTAPSPVENCFTKGLMHRALETREVEQIVESFGREAAFAQSCGFDGVEIHALHEGYLIDQFATELFNQRTDKYGGSFENRYRFAIEILQAIKKACGQAFPVSVRYSPKHYIKAMGQGALPGEEFTELGRDMPEGIKAAQYLQQMGYDALNVDSGSYDAHFWSHPPVYFEDGMYLADAAAVKKAVDIPVLCAGRMDDPAMGAQAIAQGRIDMVSVGRGLLADPQLPNKVRAGRAATVRPCISCNFGCTSNIRRTGTIGCAVNAECAKERVRRVAPAREKKSVLVVGGGPAGCEFARVSALRGHRVALWEQKDRLGGQLIPAACAPFKHHDSQLAGWFASQLGSLGVEVRLNTTACEGSILAHRADVVVFACGALPHSPAVPGLQLPHVVQACQLLQQPALAGQSVVIIGAGQVGVETALWLAQLGRQVTLVEMGDALMPDGHHNSVAMAQQLLRRDGARVLLNTRLCAVEDGRVLAEGADGPVQLPAHTVVLATGYRPQHALYQAVAPKVPQALLLGDARKVRNIYFAVNDAYEAAFCL